jgi:Carbohydrate binding domain (family 11)
LLALAIAATSCLKSRETTEARPAVVIQAYERGLAAVQTRNPQIKLSIEIDPTLPGQRALFVDYPAPDGNPASRDVWCDAERRDWTSRSAISFQVRPDRALQMSISFLDRNRVAYTSWANLKAAEWSTVRIAFDQIRPNPYFQPPGAKTGAPIDVSDVTSIGFAPQDQTAGRLAISRFVLVD